MDELERIGELGSDQPIARAEVQNAARAALLERAAESAGAEAAPRPRQRRRIRGFLGLSGAVAATAVVLFAILSSGKAPSAAPELARGASIELLAKVTPNLLIQGPQWNIAGIEAEGATEGRTVFYSEFHPETPVRWHRSRFAELRWRGDPEADRVGELEARGWVHLATQRIDEIDLAGLEGTGDSANPPHRVTRIFSPAEASGALQPRIALWEKDGQTFELKAFSTLERFEGTSERLQNVDTGEYISKSRPGLTIEPLEATVNGHRKVVRGAGIVSAPPPHKPDTPAQERALFHKVFLGDGKGEKPIVRHADGRTWMIVRRYTQISRHWLAPGG